MKIHGLLIRDLSEVILNDSIINLSMSKQNAQMNHFNAVNSYVCKFYIPHPFFIYLYNNFKASLPLFRPGWVNKWTHQEIKSFIDYIACY